MSTMEKPQCGSKADAAEYDFPLHVAAVCKWQLYTACAIVFAASIGGCGFPVVAKKVKWMKIPPPIFFFCKHFGTGVLIATAFVHVRTASWFFLASLTFAASSYSFPVSQRPMSSRAVH
jgi:zinc transporter 1/2/3